jgi:hypothetical protein
MSVFTAQILIGSAHPYDSGISDISHSLFLSESDRPAWILSPTDPFCEHKQTSSTITWIPTLENTLEDALVMIGLYVLKDQKLCDLASHFLNHPNKDFIELYNDISPEGLRELYKQTRLIEGNHKIMLSVFHSSTILKQLSVLKQYQNAIEVCRSIYTKEYSPWSNKFLTTGNLD